MIYLRQSTASQEVPLGYFVDSADGNTEKTALTIANTDIKVWKNGATTLANKNSGGATHISNGIYYAVLDATDTDTIGSLVLFVHVATALAVRVPCVVLDEAVYDVRFGTVAPATATNITGGTITTVTTLTNDPTGVGTLLTRIGTPSDLGGGATVAANLSDIEGFVDDIPTLQTELDGIQADTEDIQTRLPAALVSGRMDSSVGAMAAGVVTASAVATNAIDADALAADAVAEIAAGITIPSVAAIADGVWDEATLGHTTAGTFGEQVKTDIDDILTDTSTTLQGELDGIQADTEDIQARIGTPSDLGSGATVAANLVDIDAGGGGGGLDAAGVRAAIGLAAPNLDTQLGDLPTNAELTTALGTADDATLAAIAGLNDLDAAEVRAAVGLAAANLDTQLADLPTNAELTTALADLPTNAELTTALADLPTNAELATALASADDAVLTAIGDLPTNAELATALGTADDAVLSAIAGLNDISPAQVNAEVVDALTVDVIADSTPALGSRPTIAAGVLLTTRLLAEKEVAGTTVTVNKEDGVTPALTLTLDDAANPTSISRAT